MYTHDITSRKEAEARGAMLSREVQHRTQNLLTIMQSIAIRTLIDGRTIAEARDVFTERLRALGRANDLLMSSHWNGARIRSVIEKALEPFAKRFSIEGPDINLNAQATQGFSLIIHELSTNAHKYGAFSSLDGYVAITWTIDDQQQLVFRLTWQEHGGPLVTAPKHSSFGTTLLKSAIGGQEVGDLEYATGGLIYRFAAPLSAITLEA